MEAQNIVPNSSFEQVLQIPDDTSALANVVVDWFHGNQIKPLATHALAAEVNPNFALPNPLRYQSPRSGKSMLLYKTLGYQNMTQSLTDHRSYAATKLIRPIPNRAKVYAEFYINWHGYDCCRSEPKAFPGGQHGMLFTPDRPFENSAGIFAGNPQINTDTLLTDTVNWLKVSGTFISQERLEYIIIGNFFPSDQCKFIPPLTTGQYSGGEAFYFLEDVKVRILDPHVPDTLRVCYGDSAELIARGEENHAWALSINPSQILSRDSVFKFMPLSNTLLNFYGSFDTLQTYVIVDHFKLDLGEDTAVCAYEPFYLINPSQDADSSWWHGFGSADSLQIQESGWYSLSARKGGCLKTDSVHVELLYPEDYKLEDVESTCLGRSLQLKAKTLDHVDFHWNDGSTDSVLTVTEDGWYSISIAHPCGSIVDSLKVEFERCVCTFFLPDAFSPNGDGLNDVFKPVFKCNFDEYKLWIYNRWGQEVFKTIDPEQGWDGTDAPQGVYMFKIYYKGLNEEGMYVEDLIEESLSLIR
ncbi:gliding motility-associated C-terminal domain-containing protein [Croceimicrobium hydrocarbonivorans]|uniref:Gliding motility-associated C-terminal domain-containing protein n=1 Tax=Croceimicrobium hydrocarbonivorans TaxID=2761580 RepID=A0A7H0VD63_9FLAO|nr:gliding motility-associated C-terminal domain-containing protein [Croceimicrobium hydrocarbonivorans]QNR23661.1 gliding motility-associated C-terminal domain-containing protein [Croceimicrobium hydrocarbonivorans]